MVAARASLMPRIVMAPTAMPEGVYFPFRGARFASWTAAGGRGCCDATVGGITYATVGTVIYYDIYS
jgi:hypothetical protein